LHNYDFFASFELVMVLWNVNQTLITIMHNKIKKWASNTPFKEYKAIFHPSSIGPSMVN
jgi:hypothetical protein